MLFLIFILVIGIVVVLAIGSITIESPKKRAGRVGEQIATNTIKKVLQENDLLLTNIQLSYNGKKTELDNVIINKYGVFIIEVKNYKGTLEGDEEDYEWTKYKDDGYGNTFEKKVRNPIKQVKRQVYILANVLRDQGIDIWVEGYVIFIHNNSPVYNGNVLCDLKDIDCAIHANSGNRLDANDIEFIKDILS